MTVPIALIANNDLAGEAMGRALAAGGDVALVATATRFADAGTAFAAMTGGVVLVDATDEAARALELVRELSATRGDLRYLPLGLKDPEEAVDFLEAGAGGYLTRDASLAEVRRTIAAVAAGSPPCSPRVTALVFARLAELRRRRRPGPPPAAALSERETEVLELLAGGLRNKEIARRLGIAAATAANHVQSVLAKLGVHRRRDAVRRGVELGLIRLSRSRFLEQRPFPRSIHEETRKEMEA